MATTYETRRISPEPGSRIVASDGKEIGEVKEVRDAHIKVNKHWGKDFWLSFEEILSADTDKTVLIIPSDELNLYKLSKPHAADEGGPSGSATSEWLDREMLMRR